MFCALVTGFWSKQPVKVQTTFSSHLTIITEAIFRIGVHSILRSTNQCNPLSAFEANGRFGHWRGFRWTCFKRTETNCCLFEWPLTVHLCLLLNVKCQPDGSAVNVVPICFVSGLFSEKISKGTQSENWICLKRQRRPRHPFLPGKPASFQIGTSLWGLLECLGQMETRR